MNLVEQFQRELAKRLPYAKWVTIGSNPNAPEGKKGGTPVQIGDGGKITKGPSGLKGKKIGSVDKDKPEAKKTDKPKAKPRAPKLSIQQASNELADMGYRLIPKPVRQDLKAGKTWYAVVAPDGTTKAMTAGEIAQFVADQRQRETDLKARMVNQVMEALGRKERYSLAAAFNRAFERYGMGQPERYAAFMVDGLPRRAMPQFKGEKAAQFLEWLKERSIGCREQTIPASRLEPTQREFDDEKIDRIAEKLGDGWEGPPLIVSKDGSIIDGHHRWAAAKKLDMDVDVCVVDANVSKLLDLAWEFQDAERYSRNPLAEMFQREFQRRLNYSKEKPWEDQPRGQPDNAGQFAKKPVTKRDAKKLTQQLKRGGGFTFIPFSKHIPSTGCVVSPFPERERIFSSGITVEELQGYVDENAEFLKNTPDAGIGGWRDKESGKIYLDVIVVVDSPEKADELARKHNQEGYYNIDTGEVTIVKPPEQRRYEAGSPEWQMERVRYGGVDAGLRRFGGGFPRSSDRQENRRGGLCGTPGTRGGLVEQFNRAFAAHGVTTRRTHAS